MSAANFYIKNARGYYIVSDNEGGNIEWILDDIQENGRWDGWNKENKWVGLRRDEKLILSRRYDFPVISGWINSIEIEIVFRPGYYASGVLDWDLYTDWYIGRLTDYDDEDGFVNEIMEGAYRDLRDDGWNEGLWAIHKARIRGNIQKGIREAIERAEEFCKANSAAELRCVGVASNGEAFYETV